MACPRASFYHYLVTLLNLLDWKMQSSLVASYSKSLHFWPTLLFNILSWRLQSHMDSCHLLVQTLLLYPLWQLVRNEINHFTVDSLYLFLMILNYSINNQITIIFVQLWDGFRTTEDLPLELLLAALDLVLWFSITLQPQSLTPTTYRPFT